MNIVAQIRTRIKLMGWSYVARKSGVERPTLWRAFGDGCCPNRSPTLTTLNAVLPVIGLELEIREVRR